MKRLFSSILLAAFISSAAFAQDLNPTVVVTNTYEGEATGIVKPAQLIHIPDSVNRFKLEFDYSVFESPYRSSYEFKPYDVQLRPQPETTKNGTLYVKAGAGYTLHPDLHVVYTPLSKKASGISIFADHDSYFGKFWNYLNDGTGDIITRRDPDNHTNENGNYGYTSAGARGRFAWGSGEIESAIAWNNVFSSITRSAAFARAANFGSLEATLRSFENESYVDYDARLSVRSGFDAYKADGCGINATQAKLDGTVGGFEIGTTYLNVGADLDFQFFGATADAYLIAAVNQFAVEDPRIMCSLVSGLGIDRWLRTDDGACIDTGFKATDYAHSYQYDVIWKTAQSSGGSIIGTIANNAGFGQIYVNGSISQLWGGVGNQNTNLNAALALNTKYVDSVKFDFDAGQVTRITDGVSHTNTHNISTRPSTSAFLYAYNNGGSPAQKTKCSFADVKLYGDDVLVKWFVPFISNNVNGMLDLIGGTFHPNAASSGAFTITDVEV